MNWSLKELRKLIEAPSPEKKSAKQWLVDFLNQDFKTKFDLKDQSTVHYLGDQWVFWVDRKNKILWVHFYSAWKIFYDVYGMNDDQVQDLIREVVLEPLNCEGYTPQAHGLTDAIAVLEPLNCEGYTPHLRCG